MYRIAILCLAFLALASACASPAVACPPVVVPPSALFGYGYAAQAPVVFQAPPAVFQIPPVMSPYYAPTVPLGYGLSGYAAPAAVGYAPAAVGYSSSVGYSAGYASPFFDVGYGSYGSYGLGRGLAVRRGFALDVGGGYGSSAVIVNRGFGFRRAAIVAPFSPSVRVRVLR